MNREFSIGDVVTFKPYEKAIKGKVIEVIDKPFMRVSFIEDDDRVFYRLAGIDPKASLVTTTTGRSIVESQYYNQTEE